MAVLPGKSVPLVSPAEMQVMVSRTGLSLNPGQMADLVICLRQLAALIASIPRERPLADDLAYRFRLPPPIVDSRKQTARAGRRPSR